VLDHALRITEESVAVLMPVAELAHVLGAGKCVHLTLLAKAMGGLGVRTGVSSEKDLSA
jgi:hypothetical protein